MNLTLAIDDQVAQEARRVAESLGKSLNQLVREYLESLVGDQKKDEFAAELRRLSAASQGDSKGWRFNREEIYDRPVFSR